mgnify:CR=1 FL=1
MFSKVLQPIINFIMAAFVGLFLFSGHALAKVEINSADQAALESVRGLGPSKAKAILLEMFEMPKDAYSKDVSYIVNKKKSSFLQELINKLAKLKVAASDK